MADEANKFCVKCGHRLHPGDRFCGSCGHQADEAAELEATETVREDESQPIDGSTEDSVVAEPRGNGVDEPAVPASSGAVGDLEDQPVESPPKDPVVAGPSLAAGQVPGGGGASAPAGPPASADVGWHVRAWRTFRSWPKPVQIAAWVVLALLVIGSIGSGNQEPDASEAGSDSEASEEAEEATSSETAPPTTGPPPTTAAPEPELEVQGNWEVTDLTSVRVNGSTEPGAEVTATWPTGREASVVANGRGRFTLVIDQLEEGPTLVTIAAVTDGGGEAVERVTVTRTVSPEAYRAFARSIPYDQLVRDANTLTGEVVTYRGQVFQYDSVTTTSAMLVYVTEGEFDFWDDLVLVFLDPSIARNIDNDDIIRFWGPVAGTETYETGIGGSNTVPVVDARFMQLEEKR